MRQAGQDAEATSHSVTCTGPIRSCLQPCLSSPCAHRSWRRGEASERTAGLAFEGRRGCPIRGGNVAGCRALVARVVDVRTCACERARKFRKCGPRDLSKLSNGSSGSLGWQSPVIWNSVPWGCPRGVERTHVGLGSCTCLLKGTQSWTTEASAQAAHLLYRICALQCHGVRIFVRYLYEASATDSTRSLQYPPPDVIPPEDGRASVCSIDRTLARNLTHHLVREVAKLNQDDPRQQASRTAAVLGDDGCGTPHHEIGTSAECLAVIVNETAGWFCKGRGLITPSARQERHWPETFQVCVSPRTSAT